MSDCMNQNCCCSRRSRGGIFRTIFSLALLYVALLFGSGTLVQTGSPMAVEVGRIIQIVTFVEPTIGWAESNGYRKLAGGLRVLSDGVDVS